MTDTAVCFFVGFLVFVFGVSCANNRSYINDNTFEINTLMKHFLLHIVLFLYWYNNQTLAYRGAVSHHSRSSWWSDLPYSWRSLSLYPGNLPSALYTTLHLYRCMEREQVCKVRGRRVKDIRQEVGREEGKSGNRGRDWKKRVIRVWTNSSNEGRKDYGKNKVWYRRANRKLWVTGRNVAVQANEAKEEKEKSNRTNPIKNTVGE